MYTHEYLIVNNQNCFYTTSLVKMISVVTEIFHYRVIWLIIIYAFKNNFQESAVFKERVKTMNV